MKTAISQTDLQLAMHPAIGHDPVKRRSRFGEIYGWVGVKYAHHDYKKPMLPCTPSLTAHSACSAAINPLYPPEGETGAGASPPQNRLA